MTIYLDEDLRYIRVEREKLTTFLKEQGMSPDDLKRLCIRVQKLYHKEHPECLADQMYGLYNNSASVYVFTHKDATAGRLNDTLLHEIRHFIKRGYQPGESKLPYNTRPSEVDARAFAAHYGAIHQFITLVPRDGAQEEQEQTSVSLTGALAIAGVLYLALRFLGRSMV